MEEEKTLLLKGASKRSYVFNIYPWQAAVVCSGLVYTALRRDRFGYSVLYIGSASILNEPITGHPLLEAFDTAGWTHIGVHIEPSVLMRQVKEKDLVLNFSPVLNMK